MEWIVLVVPGPCIRPLVVFPFLFAGVFASETLAFKGSVEAVYIIVCDVLLDFGDVLEEGFGGCAGVRGDMRGEC